MTIVRLSGHRTLSALVLCAALALSGVGRAQSPSHAPDTGEAAGPGTMRGTLTRYPDARQRAVRTTHDVVGTARWRLELDSLDWRRKLTVRIQLAAPETAILVIRAAGPGVPRGSLSTKVYLDSHADPRFFTARLTVRDAGGVREFGEWSPVKGDSVEFSEDDEARPGAVVRGRLHLLGFHGVFKDRRPGERPNQWVAREIAGSFAASFDPRPAPVPRTMSDSLQRAILRRALWEFAIAWMIPVAEATPPDSVHSLVRARAFLEGRWREAAIIDSLYVDHGQIFVRLRGRHAPVTCEVMTTDSGPRCYSTRYWWSRLFW